MSKKHIPRKRFGQHFLHDPSVIQQIISAINPQPNDIMAEIGPGLGAITQHILPKVNRLDVIELDRDVIPELIANCDHSEKLFVHQQDALRYDFSELTEKPASLRIIGNLPYNISTPLIFHLLDQANIIKDMYFMLQKEVVARMAALPGEDAYGRLSVMVQYYCEVDYLFTVKPGAFTPPPKVDSAIIALRPHQQLPHAASDETLFADVVRTAFNHRRKTLRNCLKEYVNEAMWLQLNIDPVLRPEELGVKDYVDITNAIRLNLK